MIKFVVPGEPVAKGRPRIAIRGRYPVAYTPQKTKQAEQRFIQKAKEHIPEKPLEGSISVLIKFYKIRPKSYKKTKQWNIKPDLDNLIKLVLDAMNGIFFKDDSQIVQLITTKEYADFNGTEVHIETL